MLRLCTRCLLVLAGLSLVALFAAVLRHPAPALAAQSAPAPSTPSSGAVLQTNANLVLVDVVVTDHGNPVLGLDRDRFRVFEDGKERPVVAFDRHVPAPGVAPQLAAEMKAQIASLPPHTFTNLPVYPSTGVTNVLLLDALNTPVKDQQQARLEMIQYLSSIKPGTELAIFTLASHLQLVEGFTTDAARLTEVLKSKKTSSSQSVLQEPQDSSAQTQLEQEAAHLEQDSGSPPEFTIESIEQFEADLTTFQTDLRVRMTLDAFDELARYLGGISGRKNLIWFSGSFPITLDPDSSQTGYRNTESYADEIRQTDDLLTAARVAVYPIDARGLMTSTTLDVAYQPSQNSMGASGHGRGSSRSLGGNINADDTKFLTQNEEEHDAMKIVAGQTGGRAFYNTNDLKDAVAEAVDNGDSFYTLGFVPRGRLDGHYRRVKVEVGGGSYDLSYRKGYYADPASKRSSHTPGAAAPLQTALLHGAPGSTQILFAARVLPSTDPAFAAVKMSKDPIGQMVAGLKGPLHRYMVDFTVDPSTVAFPEMPQGDHRASLQFVLMAYDPSGNRINYDDRSFQLNLNPQQYAFTLHYGVRARLALDLPAGTGSLRLAVLDLSNEHTGSLEVPIAIPK
ncbi:MAG TPA: VWA domain-containing protein [Terracidiphilus sp.]|nr:VWA domain-containing protein [Terracidiphilus sp.]